MATVEYSNTVFVPDGTDTQLNSAAGRAFDVFDAEDVTVYLEGQGTKTRYVDDPSQITTDFTYQTETDTGEPTGTETTGTQFRIRIEKATDTERVGKDVDAFARALSEMGLEKSNGNAKAAARLK